MCILRQSFQPSCSKQLQVLPHCHLQMTQKLEEEKLRAMSVRDRAWFLYTTGLLRHWRDDIGCYNYIQEISLLASRKAPTRLRQNHQPAQILHKFLTGEIGCNVFKR